MLDGQNKPYLYEDEPSDPSNLHHLPGRSPFGRGHVAQLKLFRIQQLIQLLPPIMGH